MKKTTIFYYTFLFFISTFYHSFSTTPSNRIIEPFPFIQNKGQFVDNGGTIRKDIDFKVEQSGANLYFNSKGIIFHFYKEVEKNQLEYTDEELKSFEKGDYKAISKKVYFFRMDFNLINSNPNAKIISKEKSNHKYNYYLSHCPQGILNVDSYKEIIYENVYPNIDIKYYYFNNNLKYEFIVHPGGKISDIKLKYNGAKTSIIENNKLVIQNDFNTITEDKPFCYYLNSENEIKSKFKIENGIISFDINTSDISKTLIIDPTITWASYYSNTSSSDFHCNSAFDSQGNIFTAFATYNANWPTINAGAGQYYDAIKDGSLDLVIARINSNFSKQWTTYYGGDGSDVLCGTGGDYGKTLAIDGNDYLYVGGKTSNSTVFPTLSSATGGAFFQDQTKLYGGDTPFLLKFDGNGVRQWATMYQHEQANTSGAGIRINGICAKGTKIYFTGEAYRFNNNDIPLRNLAGAYNNTTFVGDQDVFVGRFDSNCILEWSTYLNSGNNTIKAYKQGADVTIDQNGNLILVGQISGSAANNGASAYLLNPGGSAYYSGTITGSIDLLITKFNTNLQPVWSTIYGGIDLDRVSEVSTDINGNILIACRTIGGAGLPTVNPGGAFYYASKQSPGNWSNPGSQDGAIVKFTPTGSLYWATYVGGTTTASSAATSSITGISSDNSGNIYVIGYTNTTNFPTQNLAGSYYQNASGGGTDMILMKFSSTGALNWSTYYGGSGNDACYGIKITPATKSGACGIYKQFNCFNTNSTNLPTVNPGSPAFYEPTISTTNSNALLYIENGSTSGTSTPPTNILGISYICASDTTTLTLNGGNLIAGSNWVWHADSCNGTIVGTGTNITVSPSTTTTYFVNAIGSCDTSICISVTINVGSPTNTTQSPSICNGQSFTLPGGNIVNVSGTYIDTLNSSNGCDSIVTTNLTVSPSINTTFNPSICSGQNYTLPGGGIANSNGTYIDTLIGVNGCDSIITTNLNVINAISTSQNPIICNGNSYTLPSGSIVNTAGVYIDTLTSTAGCDSIITTTLSYTPAFTFSQSVTICNGNSYTLPGGNIIFNAGSYKDTLTSSGGCDSIITTNVTVISISTSINNVSICSGENFTLPNGSIVNVSGVYSDTLLSYRGCDSIITTNLTVNTTPNANISPNTTITLGSSTILTASGFGSYSWYPSNGLDTASGNSVVASPNQTTTYCVIVTNSYGCKDTACTTITVENSCLNVSDLKIPNAFSPNGDFLNDEFCLQGWNNCIKDFYIVIFNRWGQKVYETKDPNFCWNGVFNNLILDSQVFVYSINAVHIVTGEQIYKNGNISLIK